MHFRNLFMALGLGAVAFSVSAPVAAQAAQLSTDVYAALPSFQNVKMSPNGQQIGYISNFDGRKVLVLENLDGSDRVALPPLDQADIMTFHWATDSRVLVIYEFADQWGGVGTKFTATRLLAIDRNGQNQGWIVKNEEVSLSGSFTRKAELAPAQLQDDILDLLPNEPDHILLALDADHDGAYEVRKIDINTGDYKIVENDIRGYQNWYVDHNGETRLRSGYVGSTSDFVASIKGADNKWTPLGKVEWAQRYDVRGFTEDANIIYVTGPSQYGTRGLYKLALDSGAITETIFEHPTVDVGGILEHPETGKPAGYYYTVDHPTYVYFDKTMAKVQSLVNKSLPDTNNYIISKARGAHTYLILADSPKDPGIYYWLDFKTKQLIAVGAYMAGFEPAQSALAQPVQIPVRDGSSIPGYLTLPKGKESVKGLPTVVLVHGGPKARDTADWDWWGQFLASRGYAVLQPNYRGSTGYGYAFEYAGRKQYGGLMQDDVTDATKWLVDQGIADGGRVCIAGASYGGYAALMGAIKEQGLYKCAVSVNGVTDVPRIKRDDKNFIGGRDWIQNTELEDHDDDDISPYHRAEDVSAAVLLVAAKDDTRIDYDMTKDMDKKLRKLGKDSTYVELEDGGHSMDTGSARLTMLKAMESFLKEQLGN